MLPVAVPSSPVAPCPAACPTCHSPWVTSPGLESSGDSGLPGPLPAEALAARWHPRDVVSPPQSGECGQDKGDKLPEPVCAGAVIMARSPCTIPGPWQSLRGDGCVPLPLVPGDLQRQNLAMGTENPKGRAGPRRCAPCLEGWWGAFCPRRVGAAALSLSCRSPCAWAGEGEKPATSQTWKVDQVRREDERARERGRFKRRKQDSSGYLMRDAGSVQPSAPRRVARRRHMGGQHGFLSGMGSPGGSEQLLFVQRLGGIHCIQSAVARLLLSSRLQPLRPRGWARGGGWDRHQPSPAAPGGEKLPLRALLS